MSLAQWKPKNNIVPNYTLYIWSRSWHGHSFSLYSRQLGIPGNIVTCLAIPDVLDALDKAKRGTWLYRKTAWRCNLHEGYILKIPTHFSTCGIPILANGNLIDEGAAKQRLFLRYRWSRAQLKPALLVPTVWAGCNPWPSTTEGDKVPYNLFWTRLAHDAEPAIYLNLW